MAWISILPVVLGADCAILTQGSKVKLLDCALISCCPFLGLLLRNLSVQLTWEYHGETDLMLLEVNRD